MKNKQTAIEGLVEQLTAIGYLDIPQGYNAVTEIISQAKEIEKQQIVEAVNTFSLTGSNEVKAVLKKYNISNSGEQYYNETFK